MTRIRPDVHARFVRVVQRALARAEQADAELRASLRRRPVTHLTYRNYKKVKPPTRVASS